MDRKLEVECSGQDEKEGLEGGYCAYRAGRSRAGTYRVSRPGSRGAGQWLRSWRRAFMVEGRRLPPVQRGARESEAEVGAGGLGIKLTRSGYDNRLFMYHRDIPSM